MRTQPEGPPTRTEVMNGPGEQFFSCAGLAMQENCRSRGTDNRDLIQDFAESGALADDFLEVVFRPDFGFEIQALFLEAISNLCDTSVGNRVVHGERNLIADL